MALFSLPQSASEDTARDALPIDRLAVFTVLWSCQALVHQEFFNGWLQAGNPLGWLVTLFALAALLRPTSLWLFSALLASSICYNVAKWPFVVNHVFLESLINFTILNAIALTWLANRGRPIDRDAFREQVFARFAPVLWASLVLMYAFAFVAKLNWGFVNPDVSCVVVMYGDLVKRFAFLPTSPAAHNVVIALTLIVEAALPLVLAFRRTRWIGVLIGLPFHLILGLVGHRTFSALAFALYGLCLIDGLVLVGNNARQWLRDAFAPRQLRLAYGLLGFVAVAGVGLLILANYQGLYRDRFAGLSIYQFPWLIWIGWSLGIMLVYGLAIYTLRQRRSGSQALSAVARPGILWIVVALVTFNGFSQYLGLKTQTCFTMYSNLRTEGPWNNHMFLPALRTAGFQDDLVQIVNTNHPELVKYVGGREYLTFFELKRIVSESDADFHLTYLRDGQKHEYEQHGGKHRATEAVAGHGLFLSKLLHFRPVSTEECAPCSH